MQELPEQDNLASHTDAKEVDKQSFLFTYPDFFTVPFLIPEDNTCQGNNLLPNVNNALFVSREDCCVCYVY